MQQSKNGRRRLSPAARIRRAAWIVWPAWLMLLAAGACTSDQADRSTFPAEAGLILAGDAGYLLKYASNDVDDPESAEEYLAEYLAEFKAIGTPDPESALPPHYSFPGSGDTVTASGLAAVSQAMANFCAASAPCDFGLLLGDNIYPRGATVGIDGIPDAQRFEDLFVEPYRRLFSDHPGFEFDVVLGNHDWYTSLAGAIAQRQFHEKSPNYHMDGFYYVRRHETPVGPIDVFALDTQMLLSSEVIPRPELEEDGDPDEYTEIEIIDPWVTEYAFTQGDQVEWLREQLAQSDATWKIVFGHHPLWSSSGGKFAQAQALRRLLLPILCRYADLYVAGHDHTLELHEQSCAGYPDSSPLPLPHIVSGAASKQRPINYIFARRQAQTMPGFKSIWAKGMLWGFIHLDLRQDNGTATIISTPDNGNGKPQVEYVYNFKRRTADQP